MPTVSVIIPCYNHARLLAGAVESALAQTRSADEIIVVDDGSTDDTPGVARRFGSRIIYVRQDNLGLAGARNTGIRRARGEVVALLDSDDLWRPTFLETMTSVVAQHPGAALYYSGWRYIDAEGRELASWGGIKQVSPPEVYRALLRADFLVPSAVILRRSIVVEAGLFDESLRSQEDWDLWIRLARRWACVGIAAPLVRYRLTPGSLSSNVAVMAAAAFRVVEKHFGRDDGPPATWSADMRRAYGGANRFCAIAALSRAGDRPACARYLRRALEADPTLARDLDLFFELTVAGQPKEDCGHFERLDLAPAAATLMTLLDNVFDRGSGAREIEATRRHSYGSAFLALGSVAYGCGKTAEARRWLIMAVRHNPMLVLHSQFLPTLARACAGQRLMGYLRRWRAPRTRG